MYDSSTNLMENVVKQYPEYFNIPNPSIGDSVKIEITADYGKFYYTDSLISVGGVVPKTGKHGVADLKIWDVLEATCVSYFNVKNNAPDCMLLSVLPWRILRKKEEYLTNMESWKIVSVKIVDANDGWFLTKINSYGKNHAEESFSVFVPTSQLLPHHFPRVDGKSKQGAFLKQFVGEIIQVKLLKFLADWSIAASEKLAVDLNKRYSELAAKIDTEEKIKVKVTGLKDNVGAFVTTEDGIVYGLIHVSQIFNPSKAPLDTLFKIGNILSVRVMRCDITKQQVGFTLRKFIPKTPIVTESVETPISTSESNS